eukprot:CAMPEP_0175301616 /NCGR_PEP_ID=MMETSP0093-20121207/61730_1 /TAXON_ID=311494 /ORGANISM="Alexandrium monilatum, Strain CCMP3105" /LENGTH=47 /DNA_ID= /DNA_START= /DNA_END= /DNA_ORIENTATION=
MGDSITQAAHASRARASRDPALRIAMAISGGGRRPGKICDTLKPKLE